jgi:hypothetical protein
MTSLTVCTHRSISLGSMTEDYSMPSVYLAGPMRGLPHYGFPIFAEAARLGRSLGWEVISPHEMDLDHGFDEMKQPDGSDVFSHDETKQFIRRDIGVLVDVLRAENGDAIAMLPGWERSVGATAENALARWAKLKVLDARTFEPLEARCD